MKNLQKKEKLLTQYSRTYSNVKHFMPNKRENWLTDYRYLIISIMANVIN